MKKTARLAKQEKQWTEPGGTDPRPGNRTANPIPLSAKLEIWRTFSDTYMKYVTMWFTASMLAFVIWSFCIKSLIMSGTSLYTRCVLGALVIVVTVIALCITLIARRRAYGFAENLESIERQFTEEEGLGAFFRPLPNTPVMKILANVSVIGTGVVLVFVLLIMILLLKDPTLFDAIDGSD